MATVYEADITDLVKPHLENAKKEGKLEGIVEGKLEGKLEKALETARKMREIGLSLEVIEKSVGLSEEELKENGIL